MVENADDPTAAFAATVAAIEVTQGSVELVLSQDLPSGYTYGSTLIAANVVSAGHGESKGEKVLGSGDATRLSQSFVLGETNVSFIADATQPSGVKAAIEVKVAGRAWEQAAGFQNSLPTDPHYTVRMTEDGQSEDHLRRRPARPTPAHRQQQRAPHLSQGHRSWRQPCGRKIYQSGQAALPGGQGAPAPAGHRRQRHGGPGVPAGKGTGHPADPGAGGVPGGLRPSGHEPEQRLAGQGLCQADGLGPQPKDRGGGGAGRRRRAGPPGRDPYRIHPGPRRTRSGGCGDGLRASDLRTGGA